MGARILVSCLLALATFATPTSTSAQDEWNWPDKPTNLKVLPKDFTGKRLRPVMTGFTRSLGVRCSHCYVGKEGEPLSTYDFASDANPKKEVARGMLRMLGSINDQLDEIRPEVKDRVNMCHTCHRGRPLPRTLVEELTLLYITAGADSTVRHYRELRTAIRDGQHS